MTGLKDQIRQTIPSRIVIDSPAEIRLMAEGTLRYRREILGLKRSLTSRDCTILLLRFFEAAGEVRKAISVIKKRSGPHETTIRELKFGPEGIEIGEALREFQGVLSGEPTFTGAPGQLLQTPNASHDRSRGTAKR